MNHADTTGGCVVCGDDGAHGTRRARESEVNVTLVTANATADELSEQDYRDIFAELRGNHTLRQFVTLSGTGYSIAWWSQFEAGIKSLTYRARCDLRRAVGLPTLPVPISDAVAEGVDDDAAVYRVGDDDKARRVLLLATPDPITVSWNGTEPVVEDTRHVATTDFVTGVTSFRQRKAYYRPCLSPEVGEVVKEHRLDVEKIVALYITEERLW